MRAQIVSFHCVLKNRVGQILGLTYNRDVITFVEAQGDLLKGLVQGLQGLNQGEKRRIQLTADEAYGFYDLGLVIEKPRSRLSRGYSLRVGDVQALVDSNGIPRNFRVIQANATTVTLDANHPLAGQDLIFEIEATEARDATPEEIEEAGSEGPAQAFFH